MDLIWKFVRWFVRKQLWTATIAIGVINVGSIFVGAFDPRVGAVFVGLAAALYLIRKKPPAPEKDPNAVEL